jgi:hypothetical protein
MDRGRSRVSRLLAQVKDVLGLSSRLFGVGTSRCWEHRRIPAGEAEIQAEVRRYRGRREDGTWDCRTDVGWSRARGMPDGRLGHQSTSNHPGGEEYSNRPFCPPDGAAAPRGQCRHHCPGPAVCTRSTPPRILRAQVLPAGPSRPHRFCVMSPQGSRQCHFGVAVMPVTVTAARTAGLFLVRVHKST